jgi:preprotein translocase subunit SecF
VATRGLNFGVDFIGGQMIRTTFVGEQAAPVEELRESIGKLGYGEPTIQRFGAENQVSIRMKLPDGADKKPELANEMAEKIIAKVKEEHPKVRIDGVDSVSGKVSSELFDKGLFALIAAALGIAAYIWIRFEWQFGVGAIWALIHDVTLTFGLFSLTQMEFDLNTIAALLTIIGYSLNDTIVIYDRIRENLMKYRKMDMPALARSFGQRNAVAHGDDQPDHPDAAGRAGAVRARRDLRLQRGDGLWYLRRLYSSVYQSAPFLIWFGVSPDSFVPAEKVADSKVERLNEGTV